MIDLKQWMKKVSKKLTTKSYTADYVSNTIVEESWTNHRVFYRTGNVISLYFNFRYTGDIPAGGGFKNIAKINNNAFLPLRIVLVNIPTQDNSGTILMQIETNGYISIYSPTKISAPTTGGFARAQITYIGSGGGDKLLYPFKWIAQILLRKEVA